MSENVEDANFIIYKIKGSIYVCYVAYFCTFLSIHECVYYELIYFCRVILLTKMLN